ncbi:hypothetical protein SmJEL517_g06214 [Synchytrium microbalum]|uniref:Calmodulin n=1 Tax=Synchytrium microbalum TaxID=1806994 RepID=A0A507BXS9_9FUNG|nr:uncharacterized protein SmJEL517_g06214 [Synchytrium microbalum]TPX30155.1 hypothetical protein SmJEL517_g06214 [Synchytrium microbalum]
MEASNSGAPSWTWQNVTVALVSVSSIALILSIVTTNSYANNQIQLLPIQPSPKIKRKKPRQSRVSQSPPDHDHIDTSSSSSPPQHLFADAATGDSIDNDTQSDESRNLLNLLYSIAEDQARKDGFVHRSITCNHCGTSPIRGFRYKCANCLDYDLCESCEAQEVHPKTHVFLKIRIPIPPLANPRTALLTAFYPGKEGAPQNLSWDDLRVLQKKTHFDQVELEAFYEQFKSLSTAPEGGITKEIFEACLGPLGVEKNLVTDRIFSFFDQNSDDIISFSELVCGLSILCKGSLDERIKHAFHGYDLDGDGFISRSELHRMFKAYFHLSMELVRDVVKTMEEGMMESFDDEAAKPVSAAFAAPIPSSNHNNDEEPAPSSKSEYDHSNHGEAGSSNHQNTNTESRLNNNEGSLSTSIQVHRSTSRNRVSYTSNVRSGGPSSTARSRVSPSTSAYQSSIIQPSSADSPIIAGDTERIHEPSRRPLSASPVPEQYATTARRRNVLVSGLVTEHLPPPLDPSLFTSSATSPFVTTPLYTPHSALNTMVPRVDSYRSPEPDRIAHFNNQNGSTSEHWPVMEAMSQDAIEEMVERTFGAAGLATEDKMDFEQFQKVVEADPNLLSWFEALGSVF